MIGNIRIFKGWGDLSRKIIENLVDGGSIIKFFGIENFVMWRIKLEFFFFVGSIELYVFFGIMYWVFLNVLIFV